MKLNKNLNELLKIKGVSLTRLAKSTGVPITTISNWLSGQSPKNIEQLKKVADHFNVSIEELAFGKSPPTREKNVLEDFTENEIYAGKYEVVLRRIVK